MEWRQTIHPPEFHSPDCDWHNFSPGSSSYTPSWLSHKGSGYCSVGSRLMSSCSRSTVVDQRIAPYDVDCGVGD